MLHIEPKDAEVKDIFGYLLGGVGPRPIALASTISASGEINLSPFSFFNAFGANPPMIVFSPSRRLRDNTTKDTYSNLLATEECVIQSVTHAMVQQVSLASTEYPSDINEFEKSGLTPVPSDIVKPPRVKESPFQMECRLKDMIELGGKKASGNLALCEVVKFHIDEDIFENGVIIPDRIDLVARMSADYYCRAFGEAIFVVKKPVGRAGIGYDQLPKFIRNSKILTANNLAQLGNCESIPSQKTILEQAGKIKAMKNVGTLERNDDSIDYLGMLKAAIVMADNNQADTSEIFERTARLSLENDDTENAWLALLYSQAINTQNN